MRGSMRGRGGEKARQKAGQKRTETRKAGKEKRRRKKSMGGRGQEGYAARDRVRRASFRYSVLHKRAQARASASPAAKNRASEQWMERDRKGGVEREQGKGVGEGGKEREER
eukprot:1755324-Rhodomonas_salina.2